MARRLLDGAGLGDMRLRRCGFRMGEDRVFRVGADGRTRQVAVERCAMGRCCSVCGPAEAAVRAAQIGAATWRWMTSSEDRSAVFVSIAGSHRASDTLADLHGQLLEARAVLMRSDSGPWKAFRRRFAVADMAWRIEHNIGPAGPHVGLHFVLLTERWWDADDAQAAEAWLVLGFRRELAAAGYTGRLSADHGVDIRPVDDPAGIGQYLVKWGVGRELAAEADKLGRNGVNVPYAAIPAVLAESLGRRDPWGERQRADRETRRLVDGWVDYVRLARADSKRHWYRGFRRLKELVPELASAHRPAEVIAVCTEVLPEQLRPEQLFDGESEDDDEPGVLLTVEGDAWEAAQTAWWWSERLPWVWAIRRRSWLDGHAASWVPLELAVVWVAEDEGVVEAAAALADLCGGEVRAGDEGISVTVDAEGLGRQAGTGSRCGSSEPGRNLNSDHPNSSSRPKI